MSETTRTGAGARDADLGAAPARAVVLGAGTMGRGIAQLLAQAGSRVTLCDANADVLEAAREALEGVFAMLEGKGRLSEPAATVAARLSYEREPPPDDAVTWVFEAVFEDLEVKRALFRQAARTYPGATLATNTSTLSVTAIAAGCPRPEDVVGLHFFNPAPLMPLVEVVAGVHTRPERVAAATAVARALGRTPVVARDRPGFIVNRVARPFYGEALRLAGEGVGVDAIDRAVKGAGFPMGPFELLDLIGIDVNLSATRSVFEAFFQEPRYRPHPLQTTMVQAGRLGRKSGRGFYGYSDGEEGPPARLAAPPATADPPPVAVLGQGSVARALRARLRTANRPAEAAIVLDARVDLADKALPDELAALPVATLCWAHSASRAVARCGRPVTGFSLVTPPAEPALVELMAPEGADAAVLAPARRAFEAHGLATLTLPDTAGGIAFRLVALLANEAASALAEGLADSGSIDTAMRLGTRYPRGPLTWAAELGLVDLEAALRGLHAETLAERFAPQPLLTRLAAVGAEGFPQRVGGTP
ncbi:MAG: 3-hydroxyacyl-CoA dehydrogenase NAD-binding domain-containing protein [Deinococcales bacterium]